MLRDIKRLWKDRKAELDEALFVIPVLLLISFGIANFSILGYASMTASNAADYGARMGLEHNPTPFLSPGRMLRGW